MRKHCTHYDSIQGILGGIRFECIKRAKHFGRHKDAYGGTWKKGKK